nr:5' exonuclease Apollo-like [Cherax quadricarinatus]
MTQLVQHFWCYVIRFSTFCYIPVGGKAKVSYLHEHVFSVEHVAQFEVPVYNLQLVHVRYPFHQLRHVVAHLGLRQCASVLQHVHQTPSGTVLEDDVDVGIIFEVVVEADDGAMPQISYPDHVIKLTVRDLGREDLLESVARRFHERILVGQGKYELLSLLRCHDAFTTNPEDARIHAVPLHQFQVSAHKKWSQEQPTISIVLTAEYVGWSNGPYSSQHENGIFIVPYSDHSSYPELLEMVAQLAPRQVVPIVQQKSPKGWWADSNAPDQAVKTDMTVYDNFLTFPPPEPVIVPEAIVDLMRKGGPFSLTHQPRRCGLHRAFTPRPRRTMGVVFTSPDRSFSSLSQHTVSPAPSSVSTLDVSIPDTYTAYHSDFSPVAKSSPDLKLLHSVNGKQLDIQNLNEEVPKNSKLEDKPSQSRVLPAPQSSLQVSNATFKQCSFNSDNGTPSKKQKISEVSHDPKPNGDLLSTFSPVTKSRNTEISSLSSSRETLKKL